MTETARTASGPGPSATGYDAGFLGTTLPTPTAMSGVADGVEWQGRRSLPYTHFSVYLSSTRHLARWVGWNIEQSTLRSGDTVSRTGLRFLADPRIPSELQTLDDVYANNRLDRGHLARRADLLWGPEPAAKAANRESFYFPNITPQMDSFNQSRAGGLWGELEDSLLAHVADTPLPRVSVFAGPVLAEHDPEYRNTQVPLDFWKLLVFNSGNTLSCMAFLLTQQLELGARPLDEEYRLYGISLSELSSRCSLRFPKVLVEVDRPSVVQPREITKLSQIRWPAVDVVDLREVVLDLRRAEETTRR